MTFGQEHAKPDGHPEGRFGRQLAVVKDTNVGPCMDESDILISAPL